MQKKHVFIIAGGGLIVLLGIGVWYLRSRSNAGLEPAMVPVVATSSSTQVVATTTPEVLEKVDEERAFVASLPVDTDGDGLVDAEEKKIGTDANDTDTDNDQRSDAQEYVDKTDPLKADPIVLRPGETVAPGSFPIDVTASTTGSILASSSASLSPAQDTDADGLSDDEELRRGTSESQADTDADGVKDGDEVLRYKTDPKNSDSDGDGYKDAEEIQKGYNPLGAGKCARADCTL